jgi:hypothetical protein
MKQKSPRNKIKQNLFNLIFISALLVLITACVCPSDRTNSDSDKTPAKNESAPQTDANYSQTKIDKNKKEDLVDFIV